MSADTGDLSKETFDVGGVRLSAVESGIRYNNRLDLVLVELAENSAISGVFTKNAFCAAPVSVAKQHLEASSSRYFLINTGNANAGTGEAGVLDAERCCRELSALAGVNATQVLPFSTGVIGERLPVEKLVSALPELYESLDSSAWLAAATGIMTTDTRPKMASKRIKIAGTSVSITGIAKGSGMIKPDMATMLAYVFTDIDLEQSVANALLHDAVEQSFNRITVDGDTSTNDCCMLAATSKSGLVYGALTQSDRDQYMLELNAVFSELATGLIRDAEGATKFVTVTVCDGATSEECLQVAYTIAESPLVKTALFASDPNWGRILAAVGRAGVPDLDIGNVAIYLGDLLIAVNGGIAPAYREELGQLEMDKEDIVVTIKLGRGSASETVWTSDLSHDYVRINADYRT